MTNAASMIPIPTGQQQKNSNQPLKTKFEHNYTTKDLDILSSNFGFKVTTVTSRGMQITQEMLEDFGMPASVSEAVVKELSELGIIEDGYLVCKKDDDGNYNLLKDFAAIQRLIDEKFKGDPNCFEQQYNSVSKALEFAVKFFNRVRDKKLTFNEIDQLHSIQVDLKKGLAGAETYTKTDLSIGNFNKLFKEDTKGAIDLDRAGSFELEAFLRSVRLQATTTSVDDLIDKKDFKQAVDELLSEGAGALQPLDDMLDGALDTLGIDESKMVDLKYSDLIPKFSQLGIPVPTELASKPNDEKVDFSELKEILALLTWRMLKEENHQVVFFKNSNNETVFGKGSKDYISNNIFSTLVIKKAVDKNPPDKEWLKKLIGKVTLNEDSIKLVAPYLSEQDVLKELKEKSTSLGKKETAKASTISKSEKKQLKRCRNNLAYAAVQILKDTKDKLNNVSDKDREIAIETLKDDKVLDIMKSMKPELKLNLIDIKGVIAELKGMLSENNTKLKDPEYQQTMSQIAGLEPLMEQDIGKDSYLYIVGQDADMRAEIMAEIDAAKAFGNNAKELEEQKETIISPKPELVTN